MPNKIAWAVALLVLYGLALSERDNFLATADFSSPTKIAIFVTDALFPLVIVGLLYTAFWVAHKLRRQKA